MLFIYLQKTCLFTLTAMHRGGIHHPARGHRFSLMVIGKYSGKKNRIILAFPILLTLVIKALPKIRHIRGQKLHEPSVLFSLSVVLFTDVTLEEWGLPGEIPVVHFKLLLSCSSDYFWKIPAHFISSVVALPR